MICNRVTVNRNPKLEFRKNHDLLLTRRAGLGTKQMWRFFPAPR